MKNISLIDVNKPEELKKTINELIDYQNSEIQAPPMTPEDIGLGNVDNTKDQDKPLSKPQKEYIDKENEKDVKLKSDEPQTIKSDVVLGEDKSLLFERGNGENVTIATITNDSGCENVNIGAIDIPLKLLHSKKDVNETIVSERPKLEIKEEDGNIKEDNLALYSDVIELENRKINKDILKNSETPNAVVSHVSIIDNSADGLDAMTLKIITRSLATGNIVDTIEIPLKLADENTRGLMSKENVQKLTEFITRVEALEGKTAKYLYQDNDKPTPEDIDAFVRSKGHEPPYTGMTVVVEKNRHVWHYYENNEIGWKDDGLDTVQQATNLTQGIVIGSTEQGKIYVESDGSMSLVGFDTLKSKTESNSQNMITDIIIEPGEDQGSLKLSYTKNSKMNVVDNIKLPGLKAAAFEDKSAFATAEQGAKADKSIDELVANELISKAVEKSESGIKEQISQVSEVANNAISYVNPQSLTDEQKAQARSNIGAGSSAFSGSYLDLEKKPKLNTTSEESLDPNEEETIQGTLSLHKISKTGKLADAITDETHETISATEKNQIELNKSEITKIKTSYAQLDDSGKISNSLLPSYVDDVQEFDTMENFPAEGEAGKIYVAKDTNLTYRWSGSQYTEISKSIALGETSSTAYPGNKGKANADAISALETRATDIESKNDSQDTAIQNAQEELDNIKKAYVETISVDSGRSPTYGGEYIRIVGQDSSGASHALYFQKDGLDFKTLDDITHTSLAISAQTLKNSVSTLETTTGNQGDSITDLQSKLSETQKNLANYLQLKGGTMQGPIKWTSDSLPQATYAAYFLTIDGFAEGGTQKWVEALKVREALGINDKQDKLRAESPSGMITITGQNDTVVTYWMSSDKKKWYRVWASGWKECGGYNQPKDVSIELGVSFTNTQYVIVVTQDEPNNTTEWGGTSNPQGIYNKTTSSFKIGSQSGVKSMSYYATGY